MIIYPQDEIENIISEQDELLLQKLVDEEKELTYISSDFNEISVVENSIGRFLKFGDAFQAGNLDTTHYKGNMPLMNYFFLPLYINKSIKNILMLGLGSGQLAKDIEASFDIEKIDIVEIDDEVINIAKDYFDFNQSPKINVHLQDARVFLRTTKTKYDLVILDLFAEDGMPYRFMTKEFLDEISRVMTKQGILGANVFSHSNLDSKENKIFKSMIKTYKSVFKSTSIFPSINSNKIFYNDVIGFNSTIDGLINIIVLASQTHFINESIKLPDNLTGYFNDLYKGELNLDNAKVLLDEYNGF